MFTGPICSMRWRNAAAGLLFGSQFLARQPRDLRVGAQHLRLHVDLGQAACLKILKIGVQLGQFAGTRRRGPRAVDPARRARS